MNTFIGKWSSYQYNGYGIMEDFQVVFCPDGSGWCEFACLGGGELLTFSWRTTGDGRVILKNKVYVLVNPDGSLEKNNDYQAKDEEGYVSVAMEVTPSGKEKEVLTTNLISGDKFALVSRELEELKRKP